MSKWEENKWKYAQYKSRGMCPRCTKYRAPDDMSGCICASCRAKEFTRRRLKRLECLAAYGGKCAWCGEKDDRLLTFDHINGGGRKERLEGGKVMWSLWKSLLDTHRNDIQVLCFNCNCGKERGITREEVYMRSIDFST